MENLFTDPFNILLMAAFIGFFMAFGIGANDVANSMGTSVGARALTIKQAILIAAVFEFLGAFLAGGEVTSTIRKGIVDPNLYTDQVNIFVIGMMSALLAGGTWLYIASLRGWPVSTTHSIVGAIIAGLSGNTNSVFNSSSIFGLLAISLAAINIFGGFLVTQRMLAMYKKKKKDK